MNFEKCLVKNIRTIYCYDMTDCSDTKKVIVLPRGQIILIISYTDSVNNNKNKNYHNVRFYCNNIVYESFIYHEFLQTFEILERQQ